MSLCPWSYTIDNILNLLFKINYPIRSEEDIIEYKHQRNFIFLKLFYI